MGKRVYHYRIRRMAVGVYRVGDAAKTLLHCHIRRRARLKVAYIRRILRLDVSHVGRINRVSDSVTGRINQIPGKLVLVGSLKKQIPVRVCYLPLKCAHLSLNGIDRAGIIPHTGIASPAPGAVAVPKGAENKSPDKSRPAGKQRHPAESVTHIYHSSLRHKKPPDE